MSASPAQGPSRPNSATPTGGQAPQIMRKKPPASSIFNQKKKPIRRPMPAQTHTANGQIPASGIQARGPIPKPGANGAQPAAPPADDPSKYQEFPIYVHKSDLQRGLSHHAMRFHVQHSQADGKPTVVNPYDEAQFTRPVRLFRKMAQEKHVREDQSEVPLGMDDKEREVREIQKAERQAQREANQALIAPTGEAGKKPMKKKPQKKVEDVYLDENNPEKKRKAQLRYEEARPWHLEDFDGKNKWVGSYEKPMSYKNVLFSLQGDGFTMVPVEKWYKMIRTGRVATFDAEQIEKIMQSRAKAPRWMMKDNKPTVDADGMLVRPKMERVKKAYDSDDDEKPIKNEEYRADVDEIDFEFGGEFQDDDEGLLFGDQDEADAKELEKRLQQEMRQANLPDSGVKDEGGVDHWEEERAEKDKAAAERKKQKKMRRKLMKKEFRHEYESDDEDEDRYQESSESEDSDEEREREEEERKKKEEEAKKAAATNGDKSGASTRGTNTPTGRPEKKAIAAGIKREAAEMSELSGNESTHKKVKTNGSISSNGGHLSPNAARGPSGYGSGSDTDTSHRRKDKLKLKLKNSPPGSPGSGTGTPKPASRAQSPARGPGLGFPTLEEVRQAIPMEGVPIGDLVKGFKTRVGGSRNGEFIALVKLAGKQDPATKKIVPKEKELPE